MTMKNSHCKNYKRTAIAPIVAVLALAMPVAAIAGTGARVEFWAPHMPNAVVLTAAGQGGGPGQVYIPPMHRYEIWGFQSGLTLGDQADGAIIRPQDPAPRPFRHGTNPGQAGSVVNSWASFGFMTDGEWYPEQMYFEGTHPGDSSGDMVVMGPTWDMTEKYPNRGFTFTPHLSANFYNWADYRNRNVSGYFYVLGVYQETAPELSGKLYLPDEILTGDEIPVGWNINRGDVSQYEMPVYQGGGEAGGGGFDVVGDDGDDGGGGDGNGGGDGDSGGTGGDGDSGGTESGGGSGGNSGGNSGGGNNNNRSGLGDGTNPGKGSGRANSPNQGTNNPNPHYDPDNPNPTWNEETQTWE